MLVFAIESHAMFIRHLNSTICSLPSRMYFRTLKAHQTSQIRKIMHI